MRLLTILVVLFFIAPVAQADYDYDYDYDDESECPGNSCNAPPTNNGGQSGDGGDGGSGFGGNQSFNGGTTIVNPGLGEGLKEAAEENVKRANRAPRPAPALSSYCDTSGFTVQTGVFGGGTSAPTFPCEVQRTKETIDKLGNGWFDQYVTKPLLHGRIFFKGLISWVPIIGS